MKVSLSSPCMSGRGLSTSPCQVSGTISFLVCCANAGADERRLSPTASAAHQIVTAEPRRSLNRLYPRRATSPLNAALRYVPVSSDTLKLFNRNLPLYIVQLISTRSWRDETLRYTLKLQILCLQILGGRSRVSCGGHATHRGATGALERAT